jgi:hypothetical protein
MGLKGPPQLPRDPLLSFWLGEARYACLPFASRVDGPGRGSNCYILDAPRSAQQVDQLACRSPCNTCFTLDLERETDNQQDAFHLAPLHSKSPALPCIYIQDNIQPLPPRPLLLCLGRTQTADNSPKTPGISSSSSSTSSSIISSSIFHTANMVRSSSAEPVAKPKRKGTFFCLLFPLLFVCLQGRSVPPATCLKRQWNRNAYSDIT